MKNLPQSKSIRFCKVLAMSLALVSFALVAPPSEAAGGGGDHGEKKKAKAPKKQRPITSLASWVMVDPITVSVVQNYQIRGQLSVSFGMDVPDQELKARVEMLLPRLQDAWLTQLTQYAATSIRAKKPGNVPAVSDLLQQTVDKVLGQPGSKVLLASVVVRVR